MNIAYVADSGKELQRHSYEDILRCTTGLDNVSFAYITHDSKDNKTSCHVFQSLDLDEVSVYVHVHVYTQIHVLYCTCICSVSAMYSTIINKSYLNSKQYTLLTDWYGNTRV